MNLALTVYAFAQCAHAIIEFFIFMYQIRKYNSPAYGGSASAARVSTISPRGGAAVLAIGTSAATGPVSITRPSPVHPLSPAHRGQSTVGRAPTIVPPSPATQPSTAPGSPTAAPTPKAAAGSSNYMDISRVHGAITSLVLLVSCVDVEGALGIYPVWLSYIFIFSVHALLYLQWVRWTIVNGKVLYRQLNKEYSLVFERILWSIPIVYECCAMPLLMYFLLAPAKDSSRWAFAIFRIMQTALSLVIIGIQFSVVAYLRRELKTFSARLTATQPNADTRHIQLALKRLTIPTVLVAVLFLWFLFSWLSDAVIIFRGGDEQRYAGTYDRPANINDTRIRGSWAVHLLIAFIAWYTSPGSAVVEGKDEKKLTGRGTGATKYVAVAGTTGGAGSARLGASARGSIPARPPVTTEPPTPMAAAGVTAAVEMPARTQVNNFVPPTGGETDSGATVAITVAPAASISAVTTI